MWRAQLSDALTLLSGISNTFERMDYNVYSWMMLCFSSPSCHCVSCCRFTLLSSGAFASRQTHQEDFISLPVMWTIQVLGTVASLALFLMINLFCDSNVCNGWEQITSLWNLSDHNFSSGWTTPLLLLAEKSLLLKFGLVLSTGVVLTLDRLSVT